MNRLKLHAIARAVAGGLTMQNVADRLRVSTKALYDRLHAGDPAMEALSPPQIAARAGHELLTIARIAEATECPVQALDPAAPWAPVWVPPGGCGEVSPAVLAELRDLLDLPPDADAHAVAEAVGALVDVAAVLESRARKAEEVAATYEGAEALLREGVAAAGAVVALGQRHGELPREGKALKAWAAKAQEAVG